MLVVALTALKIARMTASHEERVFLLTVQSRRRVSAEIIRSDDPTVSRIIVFGFLSRALSARILVRWNVAPLGLGDVGSRLNQPRHLQLRATEQSSIAPSSPSTFSSLSFFFLLILLPFLSLLSLLSLCLSSSISPRQRSISDAYYQRYSSPNPFSTDSRSLFFSLFLSLVFVFISPSTFSPLLERIPSFVDTRASFRPSTPPASTPRLVYGETWRRGSLSSRLSSGIAPFLRVVTSASSNICEKNIRSKYLNEDGGAWTSLLSFCLSFSLAFGIMSGATSWWFIEKVFRIFWGIVRVWLGIGSNYYAYSFIRCFEWYSQLDENNLSNLK